MTRWAWVVALLLCASLAGCASSAVVHPGNSTSPVVAADSFPSGSAEANRDKASKRAERLLARAVIPPGAVTLAKAPAALPEPAQGMPSVTTYVDLSRFYRVPLSFQATLDYVKAHPPAGLTDAGSGGGGGSNQSAGLAWDGTDADDLSSDGQLSVVLAPADAASTCFRVDAGEYWLDPRPVRDTESGPRLRIESGGPCPASDARAVGVRSSGADLSQLLAPASTATGGLVCFYAGLNGASFTLLHSRTLTAAEAAQLGKLAHQVDLSHSDGGVQSCPSDDGLTAVLVLAYPGRPAVDIWLDEHGCGFIANGQVVAGVDRASLLDAVRVFGR